jgi:hypothetical protein
MTESVVIPETINNLPVEVIKSEAFVCETNLREIIISKNIWEVGSHAFFGCTSLTNITLGIELTSIGANSFNNCTALTSVVIRMASPYSVPKGITFISLLVMFFGSTTILCIGLLGEYIGKIYEETKARPLFIRKSLIARGNIKPAEDRIQ